MLVSVLHRAAFSHVERTVQTDIGRTCAYHYVYVTPLNIKCLAAISRIVMSQLVVRQAERNHLLFAGSQCYALKAFQLLLLSAQSAVGVYVELSRLGARLAACILHLEGDVGRIALLQRLWRDGEVAILIGGI